MHKNDNINNVFLACYDFLRDNKTISNHIAMFLMDSIITFDNKIFSTKKYHYKSLCKRYIEIESDTSNYEKRYIFYEIVSVLLIYYITRTYPKNKKIKNKEVYEKIVIFIENNDYKDENYINKFKEEFYDLITKETPNWFYYVIDYIIANSKKAGASEALQIFLYYTLYLT